MDSHYRRRIAAISTLSALLALTPTSVTCKGGGGGFSRGGGGGGGGGGSRSTITTTTRTVRGYGSPGYSSSSTYIVPVGGTYYGNYGHSYSSNRASHQAGMIFAYVFFGFLVVFLVVVCIVHHCRRRKTAYLSSDAYSINVPPPGYYEETTTTTTTTTTDGNAPAYAAVVPCAEQPHPTGLLSNAPVSAYLAADKYQSANPAKDYLPSPEEFGMINKLGLMAWELIPETVNRDNAIRAPESKNIILFRTQNDLRVQSNIPMICTQSVGCFYFEAFIRSKPSNKTVIAIGLSTKPYPPFRLVGWNTHSIGYHSDDGRKFINDPSGGRDYAHPYGQGDIIGCGYDASTGVVYFTRNGVHLGSACSGVFHIFYPTISADGDCDVDVNFGTRPFYYVFN